MIPDAEALLLGLDIGTTHIKGVLYAPQRGQVVAQARAHTPTVSPCPGRHEHDPNALWAEARTCLRQLAAAVPPGGRVAAVAVASMGEAGTLYDAAGAPLHPIIAWHDPRTRPQRDWWAAQVAPYDLFRRTGQHLSHIHSVHKLMWLRETYPDRFARAASWLGVADMALWRLCGVRATDCTIASRTMLFDQAAGDWCRELLEIAGIPLELLPCPHPSGTVVGRVSAAAAAETGLAPGVAVVTGGHDHLCAALACGYARPMQVLDSAGTSEAILWLRDAFQPSPEMFALGYATYRHVVPGLFVVQGGLDAGDAFLDWTAQMLGLAPASERVARLLALAAEVAPGAEGVVALPYLLGKGVPQRAPEARALFAGLELRHGRREVARAAVEATAYWLRSNLDALRALLGAAPDAVIGTGRGNGAALVAQIKADVCGLPFVVPDIAEGAALGAALLAGIGVGVFASAAEAHASVRAGATRYLPDAARHAVYQAHYARVVRPLMDAIYEYYRTEPRSE